MRALLIKVYLGLCTLALMACDNGPKVVDSHGNPLIKKGNDMANGAASSDKAIWYILVLGALAWLIWREIRLLLVAKKSEKKAKNQTTQDAPATTPKDSGPSGTS